LKIALVDPKRVTFPEFEQMPWLYSPVVKESDRAIELMQALVAEMSRYQMFDAGCADLSTYNQGRPNCFHALSASLLNMQILVVLICNDM